MFLNFFLLATRSTFQTSIVISLLYYSISGTLAYKRLFYIPILVISTVYNIWDTLANLDGIVYANTYHQLHYVDVEFVKKKVQENTVNKIDKTLYLEVETATEKEE